MYATLSDSYEWKHLNSGGALDDRIMKVMYKFNSSYCCGQVEF